MDIPCVGAIVRDDAGRLMVIKRGRPPGAGLWSIPGGRVAPGEALADAVRRELREETGLLVDVGEVAGTVRLPAASPGNTYAVTDFLATVASGSSSIPVAADDAVEARWVTCDELSALETVTGLTDTLRRWRIWD